MYTAGIEPRPTLVASSCLIHCTVETLKHVPFLTKSFLSFIIKSWDNSQEIPGKYTSNCRENKTISSYSWEKTLLLQGFYLGIYFPARAVNVPSYSTYNFQASKCFYHSLNTVHSLFCYNSITAILSHFFSPPPKKNFVPIILKKTFTRKF